MPAPPLPGPRKGEKIGKSFLSKMGSAYTGFLTAPGHLDKGLYKAPHQDASSAGNWLQKGLCKAHWGPGMGTRWGPVPCPVLRQEETGAWRTSTFKGTAGP